MRRVIARLNAIRPSVGPSKLTVDVTGISPAVDDRAPMGRAAPKFFLVRRISLLIFVSQGCAVRKCVLGGQGVGGKELVRDQLGVIAQVAGTAVPPLVTAAVPRELRIDPCEKKSKRDKLRRVGQRSVGGRRRGSRSHSRSTFYSGNPAAKFAKISVFG